MPEPSQAPFPWFGGKSRAAPLIWEALGNCQNYVEPFAGSLATLLRRPHPPGTETVNDLDGFVCNVWRSIQAAPEETAHWADWPVNECDLHARHVWLRARRDALTAQLMGDPDYYDAKIAGWWLWGIACWIGSGWCSASGAGPWGVDAHGHFVHLGTVSQGVKRHRPHLGDAGRGVARQLPHLGSAGQGVARQLPEAGLLAWFTALQARLHRVRVCCGDWQRILGPAVTTAQGTTGIVLDPPYSAEEGRDMRLYAEESGTVAHDVRDWCLANGQHPLLRIVLCGYGDIHDALLAQGWRKIAWNATKGYAGGNYDNTNNTRERLWLSPACMDARQGTLF